MCKKYNFAAKLSNGKRRNLTGKKRCFAQISDWSSNRFVVCGLKGGKNNKRLHYMHASCDKCWHLVLVEVLTLLMHVYETVMEHLLGLSWLWVRIAAAMLFNKLAKKKTQSSCLCRRDTCVERCDVVRRGTVGVLAMGIVRHKVSAAPESPFLLSLMLLNSALYHTYIIRNSWAGRRGCIIQDLYSDLLGSNLLRLPVILTSVFVVFPSLLWRVIGAVSCDISWLFSNRNSLWFS
jgi:hypothetical protein